MHLARSRSLFLLAFIVSVFVTCVALYLEYGVGLRPCSLCILQRAFLITFGVVCLVAVVHSPDKAGWRMYSFIALLCALSGAVAAGSQVLLQSPLRGDVAACLQAQNASQEAMPLFLAQAFECAAGCTEIHWSLLGMSVAEWSLLAFAGMIFFAAYPLFQRVGVGANDAQEA
ncbi:disulfide bond formation protein B [Pseudomonas sp. RTC3]|uniref:disulfide bond formation protein B n=1 Tax=Pseudomonas sp. 5C2 TaxID=3048588 RepID=UPI002AB51560|nr:disulfide bond formation protein B [Pseudomonas sp. 5C2]MDY7567073.1 disulfide bond formation protein B [Pseudomonas sp. 5C2]MEB0061318.1 disulfide bond formation protein B [Pseudomonas sp. RTC3]MEB0239469.1 disulfide bond formation protein B [Pseudomonas sp. 5C2]